MGYRIMYSPEENHKYPQQKQRKNWIIPAIILAVLLASTSTRVRQKFEEWLIPGDVTVTKGAFNMMVEEIRSGEPIGEAVTAFCHTVIDNEKNEEPCAT